MIKYFWPIKSFTFFIGLLCVLSLFAFFAHYSYAPKSSCEIKFVFKTPTPIDFGIYYDIGEGLTQKDHQEKRIETINQKTEISFCIAVYNQLRTIRFDPGTEPIKMEIYSITLTYDDGTVFNVPWDSLQPGEQILSHEWDSTTFSFETIPNADDPVFVLTKLHEETLRKDIPKMILYYGNWILSGLLLMFLGRFIVLFFFLGV